MNGWVTSMFSRVFFRGFASGFTALVMLFQPLKIKRPAEFDGSVERAWRSVGRSLSDASISYRGGVGDATGGQKKRRHRRVG